DAVGLRDGVGGRGGSVRHGSLDRSAYDLVRTVTTADSPDRNCIVTRESSSAIFTGTRWTTFVKLPVALSGGSSANCDPLAGAISRTRPCVTSPGYTSMRTSTGSPTLFLVSCVLR